MQMTYYWSLNDISQVSVGELLDMSTCHTLPDWFNMHRDFCMYWMRDHPVDIGDPGHMAQIDESVVSAPKRTRNRRATKAEMDLWWHRSRDTKRPSWLKYPKAMLLHRHQSYSNAYCLVIGSISDNFLHTSHPQRSKTICSIRNFSLIVQLILTKLLQ